LRAHLTPVEVDRGAFAGTDPERVLFAYEQVVGAVGGLVAGLRPADLARPTPCGAWTVRELLDHMVWESLMVASIAEGTPRTDRGSFAPERPAPPGATTADRLAAYLGRAV